MKKINPPAAPALNLPEIPATATQQKITYPGCGCQLIGLAPLPKECPTHGLQKQTPTEMLVSVILDESGSMKSCRKATIEGYNEYLNGLQKDGNNYLITLSKFDAHNSDPTCRVQYTNEPIAQAPKLTMETYCPRGGTPLFDAIGGTVTALAPEVKGRPVLVIIMTDGEENQSYEYTSETVKALIKEKEAEGNWTFVYLGANQDAWAAGQTFGMNAGNTRGYNVGATKGVFSNLAHATVTRHALYAQSGMRNSVNYFTEAGIMDVNVDPVTTYAQTLGSRGGKARAAKQTPAERSALAKKAVLAREQNKNKV